ncbi:phosphatidate phosphatase App1p [[Candida] anglica]|uniref:Phosphatidate phosphatase App1p n=1 Tax=[Candida] anglica TaxID=148631 RepID=A0ABP0EJL4_9ASCO
MIPDDTSKRSRLLGFARATRDNYIPRIAGSVSSLMLSQEVSPDTRSAPTSLPKDATIALFPSYSTVRPAHHDANDLTYHVNVKGWLLCPGLMTRKNRLIISLARQLTRISSNQTANQEAVVGLAHAKQDVYDESDVESIVSDTSETSSTRLSPKSSSSSSTIGPNSTNTTTAPPDVLRNRLNGFIARSIPYTELTITLGSHSPDPNLNLVTKTVTTDANGNFDVCVECHYKPSAVRVAASIDETVFSYEDIMLIENSGVGLISDIDDTVKLTGVIGDKRELMRSLLLNDVSSWNIPGVIKWYTKLYGSNLGKLTFHYVSNSPWQLFPTIKEYFHQANLPPGSVHLKQYTGNIIASLMEPSSSKKKMTLYKIVGDFPNKRFICVGDSGEVDMEAYADLAKQYPSRILAIYIRVVKGSLSDVDDSRVLEEMKRIVKVMEEQEDFEDPPQEEEQTKDLIDLDSDLKSKPSPMIPKKPQQLRGNQLSRKPPLPTRPMSPSTDSSPPPPPPPPRRATTASSLSSQAPPLAPLSSTPSQTTTDLVTQALQNIYPADTYYELEEMDKRGAAWLTRVVEAKRLLRGTHTEIRFFTDNDSDLLEHTSKLISKYI